MFATEVQRVRSLWQVRGIFIGVCGANDNEERESGANDNEEKRREREIERMGSCVGASWEWKISHINILY